MSRPPGGLPLGPGVRFVARVNDLSHAGVDVFAIGQYPALTPAEADAAQGVRVLPHLPFAMMAGEALGEGGRHAGEHLRVGMAWQAVNKQHAAAPVNGANT